LTAAKSVLASSGTFENNLAGLDDMTSMFYQIPDKT
jgi:hypothetical protein